MARTTPMPELSVAGEALCGIAKENQRVAIKSSDQTRERGITGLETAIILIAFVVVASVFAFTVLSTGIFSSE